MWELNIQNKTVHKFVANRTLLFINMQILLFLKNLKYIKFGWGETACVNLKQHYLSYIWFLVAKLLYDSKWPSFSFAIFILSNILNFNKCSLNLLVHINIHDFFVKWGFTTIKLKVAFINYDGIFHMNWIFERINFHIQTYSDSNYMNQNLHTKTQPHQKPSKTKKINFFEYLQHDAIPLWYCISI